MRRDIYSQIYLESIINEENIKSLIPLIQSNLFNVYNVQSYNELQDKAKFQQDLNNSLSEIQNKVNSITDNIQYQSWIYRILKNQDKNIDEDYEVIKDAIVDFSNLCKQPSLRPEQRNILNYPKFQDLQRFILSFQDTHNLNKNIYSNLKKLYQNNKYTCYLIQDYEECNRLFGGNDYFNTGWCVAKNEEYFNRYINEDQDKFDGYIVFIITSTNKPYALLHYGSGQFKDISDDPLLDISNNIIDCLYKLNPVIYAYDDIEDDYDKVNDLNKYQKQIINLYYNNINININNINKDSFKKTEDNEYIINNINDIYVLNNLFDNRLPKIVLSDNITNNDITYLNKAFKDIISIDGLRLNSNITSLKELFYECINLESVYLLDTFNITNMDSIFRNCKSLTSVPLFDTSNVTNMDFMFCDCESLKTVPLFNTSKVTNMYCMFLGCKNLKTMPLFNTSNVTVRTCMFSDCKNLTSVPLFDTSNVREMNYMFSNCENLKTVPLFNISKVNKIDSIFKHCTTLQNQGYPIDDPIKCFEIAKRK